MIKDIAQHNQKIKGNERVIDILHRDFPQCFTSDGKFDIELFKGLVSETIPSTHEGYSLQFLGKSYASLVASTDTTTVIVPDEEHNSKPENADSKNIYISGDNLDALKHLRNSYSESIKCIYIDPPYNTGSDGFVYNDNFNYTSEQLQNRLGISEESATRILEMTTKGSASHSAWLAFMYPRLMLARDLMTKDGVIFISIDDNEQANLKLLCDYIFGEENFISLFTIKSNPKGRQSDSFCASVHDYVLVYAFDIENVSWKGATLTDKQRGEYKYTDEDGRKYRLLGLRQRGVASLREDRPDMFFPIYVNPDTKEVSLEYSDGWHTIIPKKSDGREGRWMWGRNKCIVEINRLVPRWVKKREEFDIDIKDYLSDGDDKERTSKLKTIWDDKQFSNEVGTRETTSILKADVASYPKSTALLKALIQTVVKDGDVVLDFFAGSGSTADAVSQLISSDLISDISFILVQLPEDLRQRLSSLSGEEAKKIERLIQFLDNLDYPLTLDYLAFERIRRVVGDLGFKHYTLQEPSDQTLAKLEDFNPQAFFVDNMLDEFGKDTVLCTWALRDGYGLDAELTPIDLDGYTAYLCGRHLYFVTPNLLKYGGPDPIVALIERYSNDKFFKPENIVLFGYSFTYTETEALRKNLLPLRDSIKNLKVNLDIRY